MKLPHLRSEQIKNQPDQTAALINRLVDEVEKKGSGGGGGGTSDFNELTNRPSYGNATMTGSTNIPIVPTKTSQLVNDSDFATLSDIPTKTSELINDSNFATVSQIPTKTSQLINDSDFVDSTDLATAISNHDSDPNAHSDIRSDISDIEGDITDLQNDVSAIQSVIPSTATSSNKLTDKNYVDDSINSVTAYYITKNAQGDPFATKAELLAATTFYSGGEVRIPTRNDYCIVVADESQRDPITGEDPTTRYIYNNGWEFQYIVNKTALTADQLAALNSGITANGVTKLNGIEAGAEVNVQADWSVSDNTSDAYIKNKPSIPTKTSDLINDGSDGTSFYPDWSAVAAALGDKQNVLTAGSNITIDNTDPDNPVISATGGTAQTIFCWGTIPDSTMKDSTDTTAVTGQDVYDACAAGQVIIKAKDVNPNHYDEVVSYAQQNTDYKFSVAFKDDTSGERVLREYVYSSGAWSSNEINVQEELSNATTTTDGTMSATDKTNLDNLVADFDEKVDVSNDNIDNYNGTLLDLVKGIYPENYHRWGTTTDSATANISDKPTGTTNRGFVLEAYLSRNVDASDYSYRLVCWSDRYSTVYTTYVRTSDQSITWEKLVDTTSVGEVTPTMLENGNLYDKFIAIGGIQIPNSSDLNTPAFLDLGMYFCARNVDVSTLTNCPTTNAFTMRVYSPNDDYVRDTMTGTWVYRVREIRDIAMNIYQQRAYAGNTPGSYAYSAWRRILTTDDGTISDKVDIASTDITDYAGTIADLVNGIYPEGYHRWYTQTNSGAANITDRPTTTNYGFVLEAFLDRNYTTSDYEYRLVCRTMSNDNQTYEGYVQKTTTSVNNWKKVVAGLVTNADINYNSTAVGIPTIYKMPGSGSGSAQYWKKICTLKLDTWREGTSTTVRIYAGQGYNSNPDQNFYIDLIGQTGNNNNKHFGWVAEMHQLTTGKNLGDFGVKVIAKSDTEYDVWYQTSVAYSYPHAVFYQTVQHNVTDPIVTCTFSSDAWQSAAPTGTECSLKKIMITGDYYRAGETIKLQSHYYACRYRILSSVLHAIFSIDTPRSTRHLSSFSFAATSSQYNEAYGPSGLVKSTTSATGWSFSMSRNDDDPYKIQVDATISSPASTPPHNSCGTVGITGTITLG